LIVRFDTAAAPGMSFGGDQFWHI